jgi:hypothetical protein
VIVRELSIGGTGVADPLEVLLAGGALEATGVVNAWVALAVGDLLDEDEVVGRAACPIVDVRTGAGPVGARSLGTGAAGRDALGRGTRGVTSTEAAAVTAAPVAELVEGRPCSAPPV